MRYLVQDAATRGFLAYVDGDIGVTPWIKSAFQFDSLESAVLTALAECGEGYLIFKFEVADADYQTFDLY